MAQEHIQKHETQVNRKKKNPVESLRRKKVEQRSTTKEKTGGRTTQGKENSRISAEKI